MTDCVLIVTAVVPVTDHTDCTLAIDFYEKQKEEKVRGWGGMGRAGRAVYWIVL